MPGGADWRGGGQELQPGLVQEGQWRWLPGRPVQPGINSNRSCSSLPGPGETQAFGDPFACCCNLQCNKPGDKAGIAECVLAQEAEGVGGPSGEPESVFGWPLWQRGRRILPSPQTQAAAHRPWLALLPAGSRQLFVGLQLSVG